MEHSDLVGEMAQVEHLSTQERLTLARRRRLHQLKVWSTREKEWLKHHRSHQNRAPERSSKRNIFFSDSVMLLEASARNDIEEVRRLLVKGVSPDSTNEDGLTALHQCCIDDNEEMLKLLLEFGANVNAEDSERWTPLHAAATCGHLHLVRYLISKGANLLAVNADGNMPYDICEDEQALDYIEAEMARRGVTQDLIDQTRAATENQMLHDLQYSASLGHDLETPDHQGATPLHIAAANGYLKVVEFLLDQHVFTGVKDNDDWQPVHAAACWGHPKVLELLVQNGADLNVKTKHDETPADICEDPELRELIIQLRSEQETRRMQEVKGKRVNRTQSNTRTQSVRRTSIRDRALTSKKEAVEEARLRLQPQDETPKSDAPPYKIPPTNGSEKNSHDIIDGPVNNDHALVIRREPDGKDQDALNEAEDDKNANDDGVDSNEVQDSNGNINVIIHVTINSGTLADLKKQRAQNRNSSPEAMNSLTPISQNLSTTNSSSTIVAGTSSPLSIRRFTGNTADMVTDPRTGRCCVIS